MRIFKPKTYLLATVLVNILYAFNILYLIYLPHIARFYNSIGANLQLALTVILFLYGVIGAWRAREKKPLYLLGALLSALSFFWLTVDAWPGETSVPPTV